MSAHQSAGSWLRQRFGWSNSRESWLDRILLVAFFLVGLGLAVISFLFAPLAVSAVLWSIYFVGFAVCYRQGWVRLLGPVLFYDMICTARRSRYVIMRLLYAVFLLFILCYLFLQLQANHHAGDMEVVGWAMLGLFAFVAVQIGLGTLFYFIHERIGRIILATLMALSILLVMVGIFLLDSDNQRGPGLPNDRNVREAAQLAEAFFSVFMSVQMAMVVLLTPAYVAGAIAEEKDRKTLEFLLATDLHNREIVLSKLLSRLANLTLLLLTGLPILSILQFIGGVDTDLMIAGFVGTGLAMLGIASLSILMSTLFKRPRDAIGITYLVLIAYIAIGTVGFGTNMSGVWWMQTEIWFNNEYHLLGIPLWHSADAPTIGDASRVINAGNPLTAMIEIAMAIEGFGRGGGRLTLAAELPGIIWRFAWFHVPLSAFCVAWSVMRLRGIALKQTVGGTTAKASWWQRFRPPVGELPMLWKEMHLEGGMKLNWLMFIVAMLLVLLTFGSGLLVLGEHLWSMMLGGNRWGSLSESMNVWFRTAGTGVAGLMILNIAVRASTSISTERERDTFDALITTPMSSESMLAAKLLGSMSSLRLAWLWCGAMLALGLFTGGVHMLAVPLLVTAFIIYASLFAMIGMWFSMVSKTSLRATVYTVLTTIAVSVGHWLVTGMCCFLPLAFARMNRGGTDIAEYFAKFQAGLTPPFVFGFLAYSWRDLERDFNQREFGELMIFSLIGLFLSAMACLVLWFGVLVPKFRQITRREETLYQ